jgi:hypothetical protein
LAYCLDGIGRTIAFIGVGSFFGSALLRIAKVKHSFFFFAE